MGGGGVLREDAKRDDEERIRRLDFLGEFFGGCWALDRRDAGVNGVTFPQYGLFPS